MKSKNAFEASGNSPTATAVKTSPSGAPIQTGCGLQQVLKEITEKFERIRQHSVQGPDRGLAESPQAPVEYDVHHKARFHERAKRLSLAALSTAHIMKPARGPVFEISVPTESAEELIREALGE